ncbi:chorion transcription factor Cf2-like [Leguminivora glycinivorella]|uniref:chorion transcription factor Cf2-like n=1 Tax=Leguminivora glycinivorella TaxID=1035111 RepID=UPI00200BD554|nr:chorion transcription factor Cf2-like [Leguminivora glycinivorella]
MQSEHGEVTEYPCHYCDKKFAYAAYRTKHIRTIHLEARPHKCQDCPFSFARRRELDAHRASKHGDGEMKYQCNVCQKKFFFNSALKFHVNLHNRFACTQCDTKFTDQNELDAHMSTHTKDLEPLDHSLDGLPILDSLEFNELTDYALDSDLWVFGNEL